MIVYYYIGTNDDFIDVYKLLLDEYFRKHKHLNDNQTVA
jgi:hypothetical protein